MLLCCKPDGRSNGACYAVFGTRAAAVTLLTSRDFRPMCRRHVAVHPTSFDEIRLAMALGILVGLRAAPPWSTTVVCTGMPEENVLAVTAAANGFGVVGRCDQITVPLPNTRTGEAGAGAGAGSAMHHVVEFTRLDDFDGLRSLREVAGSVVSFRAGARAKPPEDVTLFVGGLHPDTDDRSLRAAFQRLGRVSFARVKRNEIQLSRGFGFVAVDHALAPSLVNTRIMIDGKYAEVKAQTRR